MVAFLLLFVSIFFISVSTYWQVFVASGVIGLVMGLPTLILSQILWCYNTAKTNKTKCVMMVYGGFTLLTSLCCFIIGLFLLLYPECNYNYYMDCSGSGSDYDDDYHDHNRWLQNYQEHHERLLPGNARPEEDLGTVPCNRQVQPKLDILDSADERPRRAPILCSDAIPGKVLRTPGWRRD